VFSSSRRHTRFSRDWSSDVCSSDLHEAVFVLVPLRDAGMAQLFGRVLAVLGQDVGVADEPAHEHLRPVAIAWIVRGDRWIEDDEIGRASCRERASRSVGAVPWSGTE